MQLSQYAIELCNLDYLLPLIICIPMIKFIYSTSAISCFALKTSLNFIKSVTWFEICTGGQKLFPHEVLLCV